MTISPTQKRRLTAKLLKNPYAKTVVMILLMFVAISGFILPQPVSLVSTQASTDKIDPQHCKEVGPGNSLAAELPTETYPSMHEASFLRENAVDGRFTSVGDIATGFNWKAESNALWNSNLARDMGAARATYSMTPSTGARLAMRPIAAQEDTSCVRGVQPDGKDFTIDGGSDRFVVSADAGCAWRIAETISWIHILGPIDRIRIGREEVFYTVDDNPAPNEARTSKIEIVVERRVAAFHAVSQQGTAPPPTPAPTITSFTANPPSITSGQSSTLSWESSNGTSATIDNGIGAVDPNDSITVSPTSTTTYTLTVSNSAGNDTESTTVTVAPPGGPTITSFTAIPSSITSGELSTLSWSSSNGTSATIDNGIGAVDPNDSITVSPTSTTTYTLTVINSAGNDTESTTVTVAPPGGPTITSFTANPPSITSGQFSTLSWASSNGTSATITGVGPVSLSGSVSVSPAITTTFTLTVSNSIASVTASTTVTVTPPGAPTITSFTADPSSVTSGESSTLSWASSNGTSATIDKGIGVVAVNGSVSVAPTITTTYTLTVSNSVASVTASTTVTVTPPSANCTFTLSPKMAFVGEGEGNFVNSLGFTVTPTDGCGWTATTTDPWIVIKEETSSSEGKGSVIYTVKENTGTEPRCGSIVVGVEKHTVIQAAAGSPLDQRGCPNPNIGHIVLGQTIHGTLTENDEKSDEDLRGDAFFRDRYQFRLEKTQEVAINVASADFDPFLFLLDEQGKLIARNRDDDGAGFRSSRLPRLPAKEEYLLLGPGLYIVEVTSFSTSNRRGNYALYLASKEIQSIPIILTAILDQKSLIVIGENFEAGAKLFIGNSKTEEKDTTNDQSRSRTALIALKSAKNVKKKAPLILRVVNQSNGREADVFVFPSRPLP